MSLKTALAGQGLFARALRGSALTAAAYAASQALRLAANLVLARFLFPEAFGVMALVMVVLVGLALFSDMGVGPAISQHPQGDAPAFLDTAYSFNVMRGAVLWLLTCAAAMPVAGFYAAPELAGLLPVAGLTLLIAGFYPTRIDTATRHLLLGRVIALDLAAQLIGTVLMLVLAYALQSVWALVAGAVGGALAKLFLMRRGLPGPANRFAWDPASGRDLLRFGKWIFLSSICGFLLLQGDKAILGAYLSLHELGVYNIGYVLASFPLALCTAVTAKVLIPVYRDRPPAASPENAARLRRMRFGLSGGTLLLLALIGFFGMPLVSALYDARYLQAGAFTVVIACVLMPGVIGLSYDQAALAAGDSRGFFLLTALRALVQTSAFLAGVHQGGAFGGLLAQALALSVLHGPIILLARRHKVWDPLHDAVFLALAAGLAALTLWANAGALGLIRP